MKYTSTRRLSLDELRELLSGSVFVLLAWHGSFLWDTRFRGLGVIPPKSSVEGLSFRLLVTGSPEGSPTRKFASQLKRLQWRLALNPILLNLAGSTETLPPKHSKSIAANLWTCRP